MVKLACCGIGATVNVATFVQPLDVVIVTLFTPGVSPASSRSAIHRGDRTWHWAPRCCKLGLPLGLNVTFKFTLFVTMLLHDAFITDLYMVLDEP